MYTEAAFYGLYVIMSGRMHRRGRAVADELSRQVKSCADLFKGAVQIFDPGIIVVSSGCDLVRLPRNLDHETDPIQIKG